MRETLPPILRCPSCGHSGAWAVFVGEHDGREIREGSVCCERCAAARPIRGGIVDLLVDPPAFVVREAAGLRRFADHMRGEGWNRELVLQLPHVEDGYWYHQAIGIQQLLESSATAPHLQPGQRILDVGANTCWASAMFAERGMDVVALDITDHVLQGLQTADWWIEGKDIHFERTLATMFDLPFADASFDAVFCCEVLHHNHRANLARTLSELHRVLRPGGRMFVINEPVRALRSPKLRPKRAKKIAQFEGHEHAYLRASYVRTARAAGFAVEVVGPWLLPPFREDTWTIGPQTRALRAVQMAAGHVVRKRPLLRRAYLAWKTYITGTSLYMVGTKGS